MSHVHVDHSVSSVRLPPFQTLLDAHGHAVWRLLAALVGPVDAEDCYQETWIAAMRAYPRLREDSNLRGWLLTIARRKAIDHVRARRHDAIPVDEIPEPRAAHHNPGPAPDPPDQELWERVRRLPEKQRTALSLRYVVDADYALISRVMDTSEDAARRNVHEALTKLRSEVAR